MIYIAGRISGDPGYKSKFKKAENVLRETGLDVMNPAILPESLTREQAMPICMELLKCCDSICLLDDWYTSIGAREEMRAALEAGLRVMTLKYRPEIEQMSETDKNNWMMELEAEV